MSRFLYFVAASVLHDAPAVEGIFSRYEPAFRAAGGERFDPDGRPRDDGRDALPLVVFVLTGGTEGIVLEALGPQGRDRPLLIAAHPEHNSLPAALEILARIRQDGGSGAVVVLRGPEDARGKAELERRVGVLAAAARMKRLRIGTVGEPSDWLVASSQGAGIVADAWGPTLVPITVDDLRSRMHAVRAAGGKPDAEARVFWDEADSLSGPAEEDLRKSWSVYKALRDIVDERHLDALTLRCFDLVTMDASTGCYALSRLADEGVDAGCEGDVPSILALAWMRSLTGEPAWMANPADIRAEEGRLLLAHCTVPRTGLAGYSIRTHFESGLGVAVAGTFPEGPVTLVRIGGKDLRRTWIARAEILESPRREGLCRTQIIASADPEVLRSLLEAPLGNHVVIARGDRTAETREYLSLIGAAGQDAGLRPE